MLDRGDKEHMRASKTRIIAVLAVVAVVLGLVAWGVSQNRQTDVSQPPIASSPTDVVLTSAPPTTAGETPTPTSFPEGCPADPQEITNPVSMTLVTQNLEMPMISVGLDADGAAGAPPGNEGYTIAWFDQGPRLGSDIGKAVLTSHTFQFGGALGNDLNEGLLNLGDIIKVADAEGNTACYRYSGNHHVMVADYDPDSDILYDYEGKPQIAIVVCSDYTAAGEALGRVIYYGDLVFEPVVGEQPAPESTPIEIGASAVPAQPAA